MNEKEAREKWCPFTRLSMVSVEMTLKDKLNKTRQDGNNCIASDCAAWRWVGSDKKGNPPTFSTSESNNRKMIHGYCGLAGKP